MGHPGYLAQSSLLLLLPCSASISIQQKFWCCSPAVSRLSWLSPGWHVKPGSARQSHICGNSCTQGPMNTHRLADGYAQPSHNDKSFIVVSASKPNLNAHSLGHLSCMHPFPLSVKIKKSIKDCSQSQRSSLFFLRFIFMRTCELLHIYTRTTCVPSTLRSQKMESNPMYLELLILFLFVWFLFSQDRVSLELQILLSHQVGSGSRTWILGHSIAL